MGTRYDADAGARYRAARARLHASYGGQHSDGELVQAVREDAAADADAYLDALAVITAERARLDAAEVAVIEGGQALNASWTQIATALGLGSRQGAQQYYRRVLTARQQSVDGSDAAAVAPTPETGDAAPVATVAPGQQNVDTTDDAADTITSMPERQRIVDTASESQADDGAEPLEVYLATLHDGAYAVFTGGARVGWVRTSAEGAQVGPATAAAAVATTPERDLASAARLAARTLAGHTGPVTMRTGPLLDHWGRALDTSPGALAEWTLQRGRVAGRTDVVVRHRTVGWLQEQAKGYTAHTVDGPLAHAPTDRTRAAHHVLAALWAPLPVPDLGSLGAKARRVRARPTNEKPLCPYEESQLARAAETPQKVPETDVYRVQITDHLGDTAILGYVRRESSRRTWGAWRPDPHHPATATEDAPVIRRANTRTEAIDQLLAVPGPLWADPADGTTH